MIKPHITDTAKYFGKKQSETIAFVLTLLCSPQTWNAILSNQLKSNNVLKNELVQILKFEWFNHHRFRFLNYKNWFSVTDTFFLFLYSSVPNSCVVLISVLLGKFSEI